MDTFAGFEFLGGKVTENIIVFHPSLGQYVKGWDIIESEHSDFYNFMLERVLPEMKVWIPGYDLNDYIT